MSNPNATMRTTQRRAHLLAGFLIGVFAYTPARDNEALVLIMQAAVVPAVTLTGLWMWQQARIRRLHRNPGHRKRNRSRTPEGTRGGVDSL